jgi:N6-adenosine-specific RNA methylase IME4
MTIDALLPEVRRLHDQGLGSRQIAKALGISKDAALRLEKKVEIEDLRQGKALAGPSSTPLMRYEAACRALAEAKIVDEVKNIRDQAMAMKLYARQAKNKDLEADASEIRLRAEQRLGQMMDAQRKSIGFNPGHRFTGGVSETPPAPPTLDEAGIDKNLAKRARRLNSLSNEEFEAMIENVRDDVRHSAERSALAKATRQEKHERIARGALAAVPVDLATFGPFPMIYADPPWKWGHFGEKDQENEAGKERTPDQHYPTLTYDAIAAFSIQGKPIREIAHKDAVLMLWCTSANIPYALRVMRAWDFEYKSHAVWVKDRPGLGLIFRNQHELLLMGTRGNMPGPQYQPWSVFEYPRGPHSAKPAEIRAEIERMYPAFDGATRLELFARAQVPGWTTYGFETNISAT